MNVDSGEELVFVHHAGTTTAFARRDAPRQSSFGGPSCFAVTGAKFGPRPLHQIGLLAAADFLADSHSMPHEALPLVYGMNFDGCDLCYRVSRSTIDVKFIAPDRSSDDWPYQRYPTELPEVPLGRSRSWQEDWEDFRDRLVPTLNEWSTSKITVVVPAPENLGFSLWGAAGDAEGASIVFQYSLEDNTVRAFSLCS